MLRKLSLAVVAITVVMFFSSPGAEFSSKIIAQDSVPPLDSDSDSPTIEETTLASAPTATTPAANAFVIVCDSRPNQIIVLDAQGKWIPTVQSATIKVEIGHSPQITCVMWSGLFKPTNPETKVWTLAQMKSVTAQQFQQYVDQLQTDPSAIARSLSGGTTPTTPAAGTGTNQ